MIKELLKFEIKNHLIRPSSLIYFLIYFSLSFFLSVTFADAFKNINYNLGYPGDIALNSPIIINHIITSLGNLALLIFFPIFAQSIFRDFEHNFRQLVFSTPIKKSIYFFTRFFGCFIYMLIVLSSIGLGIYLATFMPFINSSHIHNNHFSYYLFPYLFTIIPNLFIFGALSFSIIVFFQKMTQVYIASALLFFGYILSSILFSNIDNKLIAAILDPLGSIAKDFITRYWSIYEQNTKIIALSGYFLYNRITWGFIGFITVSFSYFFFNPYKLIKEKKKNNEEKFQFPIKTFNISTNPKSIKIFFRLIKSEIVQAFLNFNFLIILLSGILFLFISSKEINKIYGTPTIPVTYLMLEGVSSIFQLFILILTSFYAGELIYKDRLKGLCEIKDSAPLSNSFYYLSKLSSLIFFQIFFCFIIFIASIIIQIINNYYYFEFKIYFQYLFLYLLIPNIYTSILILFFHVLSNNKNFAHFIIVIYFTALIGLQTLGFDHYLYLLGHLPNVVYSDMNKFGTSFLPFLMYAIYWGIFHFLIAYISILFWKRGSILNFKFRFIEFRSQIDLLGKKVIFSSLFIWLVVGGIIYYNTNILNSYKLKSSKIQEQAKYENKYKNFESISQPELYSVSAKVDLFPKSQYMITNALLKYKNNSSTAINKIFVNLSPNSNIIFLNWNKEVVTSLTDDELGVKIFDLVRPLNPQESIELSFAVNVQQKGFQNSTFSKKIVENGTFFYGSDFFPIVGYCSDREIVNNKLRKKYNLCFKNKMNKLSDEKARNKTYLSSDGTWIDFETIISTSKDQTALSVGNLINKWTKNNRNYFHYKTDKPILNFYPFLSARYEIVKDKWEDIDIEIYHHPKHFYNIARMIQSIKSSLNYYSKNFSPYQFKHIRIVEFPRYSQFAQAFPGLIPYSESLGFIAKIDDNTDDIDYIFYVTAHEVAHQWWAHQVVGANVQGATMLSESLAQYSALMVQEKEYGKDKMKKFLKYELDNYLSGRSKEADEELPIMLNENQEYIHYNKGSLVFYALKDYLKEKFINKILNDYIKDVAYQKPPFTISTDLVNRFKTKIPIDKKYLIEDLFETITFYQTTLKKASVKTKDNNYLIILQTDNKKFRSNKSGQEKEVLMNDLVDIGVFDEKGEIIYLKKHRFKNGNNSFKIQIDKKPYKVGIDPFNKLIEKNSKDLLIKNILVHDKN